MADKKNRMIMPRDGVVEHGYHPPKQENPPKNPPKGGISVAPPENTPNNPPKGRVAVPSSQKSEKPDH